MKLTKDGKLKVKMPIHKMPYCNQIKESQTPQRLDDLKPPFSQEACVPEREENLEVVRNGVFAKNRDISMTSSELPELEYKYGLQALYQSMWFVSKEEFDELKNDQDFGAYTFIEPESVHAREQAIVRKLKDITVRLYFESTRMDALLEQEKLIKEMEKE